MMIKETRIKNTLTRLLRQKSLRKIRAAIQHLNSTPGHEAADVHAKTKNAVKKQSTAFKPEILRQEFDQILAAQTLLRAKYYIRRLIRALSGKKTGAMNDLNLHRWKEYDDILTDSLWIVDRRDTSGAHEGGYWGNFIPQIPNQLLRRYTKRGEWVLDTFLGSGTTLIECKRLGRNGVGVELQGSVARKASTTISREANPYLSSTEIIVGDSTRLDFQSELSKRKIKRVQFLMMHPPYWDIVKFSSNKRDLSNAKTIDEFLKLLGSIIDATYPVLDQGRYCALVIGDKYSGGSWIPLGFFAMQEVLKRGYSLKSIIVKNFDETKGKRNQKELWRYRALAGGFYIFKHEYIFLFKKTLRKASTSTI